MQDYVLKKSSSHEKGCFQFVNKTDLKVEEDTEVFELKKKKYEILMKEIFKTVQIFLSF